MPRALITGIAGQDGRYLAELLHEQRYDVYGLATGEDGVRAVQEDLPFAEVLAGDLRDGASLVAAVERAQPDEVYNLGGVSFVALSFREPHLTAEVNALGALKLLEAIRLVGGPETRTRFYQAASSEMFGRPTEAPQTEATPFHPVSPYGVSKVFAYHITVTYRESYGLFACNGILYNHESPRRPVEYVTRKITNGVARIKLGLQETIALGNVDAERDWGFAGDYVRAMWLMLQHDTPDDYVVATGRSHTVRDLVAAAFAAADIDDWERHVVVDERYLRPAEVHRLVGDASKARRLLGWEPTVEFDELVRMMVEHDLKHESQRRQGPT